MHQIGVVLSEESYHFLDHLAPLSHILQAPLLLSSEEHFEACVEYYPDTLPQKLDYFDFTPQFFLENFDALLVAEAWDRTTTAQKFQGLEEIYKKKMRVIHCPHGFSDKTYFFRDSVREDILFVFGQNLIDLLKGENVLDHMAYFVMVGNFRYHYYNKYKEHFDALISKKILKGIERREKVFLYAPTWVDSENGSTFFDFYKELFSSVPEEYTLLVKPHPLLEHDFPAEFARVQGEADKRDNVHFIQETQLIYPLLNQVDVYVGDRSSIGYDFLAFDRPLFFINKQKLPSTDRRAYLHQAGVAVQPEKMGQFWGIVQKELADQEKERSLSKIRREMYHYSFASDVGFDDIVEGTYDALQQPRLD